MSTDPNAPAGARSQSPEPEPGSKSRQALPYCIVGGGPSGLIAARAFKRAGIPFELVERFDKIGGIWNIDQPGTPVYESCNFIAHRRHGGFAGFPFPEDYPDFPTWRQVRDYIYRFVDEFDLMPHVRLSDGVVRATPPDEGSREWNVRFDSGTERRYRGVVWACGQQQTAVVPDYSGMDSFQGRLIHSRDYFRGSEFTDQRVLVVGAGNSGVDIVCDAVAFGKSATLSMRRGYWFFPKLVFGQPLNDFFLGAAVLPEGFPSLANKSEREIRDFILATVGELTRLGLPAPDHAPGATHPIVNDQAIHYLEHGRLIVRPNIAEILPQGARFVDGTVDEFDQIVFATGYRIDIPWLEPDLIEWTAGQPNFHLGTFSRKTKGLYAAGLIHLATRPIYVIWDQMAQLIVADIRANEGLPRTEHLRGLLDEPIPDLKGPGGMVDTARNVLHVDAKTLENVLAHLSAKFGIDMPKGLWDIAFYDDLRVSSDTTV